MILLDQSNNNLETRYQQSLLRAKTEFLRSEILEHGLTILQLIAMKDSPAITELQAMPIRDILGIHSDEDLR